MPQRSRGVCSGHIYLRPLGDAAAAPRLLLAVVVGSKADWPDDWQAWAWPSGGVGYWSGGKALEPDMVGSRVVGLDFPLTWLGRRPCRQALCREERGISFASRPIRHLLVGPDGRLAWLLATLSREPELGRVQCCPQDHHG